MTDNIGASNLTLAEEQAFQLSRCAIAIDQARQQRAEKPGLMVEALNENLEIWVALRTLVMRDDCTLPNPIKENLVKLSRFVADKTFASSEGLAEETLDTLINVNLQISEGLLEGARSG